MKTFAALLGDKIPSRYHHVDGLDTRRQQIMLYGWKEIEDKITQAVIGFTGSGAIRVMFDASRQYAAENKGIFSAMLWYNQFENAD